jgi:predicted phosphoadenosine phosphosulfate sulfurtransferase
VSKLYLPHSVLDALHERLAWIFDRYERVVVSVSSGKDSTVLFDAARKAAVGRGREVDVFFLDQEAEYQSTVDLIRRMMAMEGVRPWWFQVPIRMTNATSYAEDLLYAWGPGEEWVRAKEPDSIHEAPGAPQRFYPFFEWFEQQWGPEACFLVGLRSEESLNRYRAVTRWPGVPGVNWSSRGKGVPKFYPLYDWAYEDVWTYIGKFRVPYNRIYDFLYAKGKNIPEMRVSNLIHEKAFKALATLQEFEPETYDRLVRRLKGVHVAALYAQEQMVFSTSKRPPRFTTWREYRDFLLDTLPTDGRVLFEQRFGRHEENERVYRQQVRQLLLNDWENNIPVTAKADTANPLAKWAEIL